MIQTTTRNATLADLAALLKDQHARKVDVITPATAMRFHGGTLRLASDEQILGPGGVTAVAGDYRPSDLFDADIADRLGIPVKYLRKLREQRPDLYDANLNGWLHGRVRVTGEGREVLAEPDGRSFLLRCFRGDDGTGYARSLLSNRYRIVDNLDVLTAALDGIRESGVTVEVDSCDLTERRMVVRVACPEVRALAPTLLAGYRSPFAGHAAVARAGGLTIEQGRRLAQREGLGYAEGAEPVVFAGFVISNSETGDGKFTITPRLVVQVCRNGLTFTQDALGAVHVGGIQEDGVVRWADDTQAKTLELVTLRARDAVRTFLDAEYLTGKVAELEAKAGALVEDPKATIAAVGRALKYDEATQAGILDHFIRGGQMTAAGLLNAATSYAQTVGDADAAWEIEQVAVRALELAA